MALTQCPDINVHILHLLLPREFLKFGMVDKYGHMLVRKSSIYAELLRLKFDKHLHRFDSYQIIKYYYKHNMINLITQHKFDHYRAIVIAARYGHLDLIKLIYQAKPVDFPYARYNFQCRNVLIDAIMTASAYHHYHILKWFTDVDILDSWLMPRRLINKKLNVDDQYHIIMRLLIYASTLGDLSLLLTCKNTFDIMPYWSNITTAAFEHGHIAVLDWLVDMIKVENYQDNLGIPGIPGLTAVLPYDIDPAQTLTNQMLNWYWKNFAKFANGLYLTFNSMSLPYQLATLEQIHGRLTDINPQFITQLMLHNLSCGSGNLNLLEWIYSKDEYRYLCTDRIDDIVVRICYNNQIHIVEWLESVGLFRYNSHLTASPISSGSMPMIQWFKERTITFGNINDHIYRVASQGYLHVLAWLRQHHYLDKDSYHNILQGAIVGNQPHIVEWLGNALVKELITDTLDTLIIKNHIGFAIKYSRINILELLCRYHLLDVIIQFITEHKYQFALDEIYELIFDTYPLVRWLTEWKIPFDYAIILDRAIRYDEWHVVDWIVEHHLTDIMELSEKRRKKYSHCLLYRSTSRS